MKKVCISVWEPTLKGCKQRTKMYTRLVHKDLTSGEYVRLHGSKWRIRQSIVMKNTFILAGMLE